MAAFRAVEGRFPHLKVTWSEDDPFSEITFDVQPGLEFAVGASHLGDILCLWAGNNFACEWFPSSDQKQANEFRRCFEGVLSGQFRVVEFVRKGKVFKAHLQDHSTGSWQTLQSWGKLTWPSFREPSVRVLRNRPSERRLGSEFDRGLIADLRHEAIPGDDTFAKAWEAVRSEATREDLPLLRSLLADESAVVREAVAWPIADLEGLPALRDLLIAYQRGIDEGSDNDGFTALLLDMIARDPRTAGSYLQSLTVDPAPHVRENALWLRTHCAASAEEVG